MRREITDDLFEEKYYKYKDTLYRIAYSYLKNREDSTDCVQDVFMKYLDSTTKFDNDDGEFYWLIRVTINTSLSYLKTSWKKRVTLNNEYVESTNEKIESAEIDYKALITNLPQKYKDVVVLFYWEDFSIKRIADALNISESNVKKRLERARNKMREEIKNGQI